MKPKVSNVLSLQQEQIVVRWLTEHKEITKDNFNQNHERQKKKFKQKKVLMSVTPLNIPDKKSIGELVARAV